MLQGGEEEVWKDHGWIEDVQFSRHGRKASRPSQVCVTYCATSLEGLTPTHNMLDCTLSQLQEQVCVALVATNPCLLCTTAFLLLHIHISCRGYTWVLCTHVPEGGGVSRQCAGVLVAPLHQGIYALLGGAGSIQDGLMCAVGVLQVGPLQLCKHLRQALQQQQHDADGNIVDGGCFAAALCT
jgi:hypothetical protein